MSKLELGKTAISQAKQYHRLGLHIPAEGQLAKSLAIAHT